VSTAPAAPTDPDAPAALLLNGDDWQVLQELLPDLRFPGDFESRWALLAGEDEVAAARAASLERLRERELIVADGVPHPAMRTALAMFSLPTLRARVRSWDGELAVLAELAVGPRTGVGLARLLRIQTTGGHPAVVREGPLVELSVFPASGTVRAIQRAMPPIAVPGERRPDRAPPQAGMYAPWEDALALADALARAPAPDAGPTQARLHATVLELLLEQAGLSEVPPILADVATALTGAVEVDLVTGASAGPGLLDPRSPAWLGRWLVAGDRLVGLTLAPAPPAPAAATTAAAAPDPGRGARLGLLPADAISVSTDLLSAVTAAFTLQDRLRRAAASTNGSIHD
jgi:hypothetical protein